MPGPTGIFVNGANAVIPGVIPYNDTRAMAAAAPGLGGSILVLGTADGGDPSVTYEFTSSEDARKVLRGGDALAHIYRMFRPSGEHPGAWLVRFLRVGAPAAATFTGAGVVFTARDKGRHTNGISVKIAAGGVANTWDVTVKKAADGYSRVYTVGLGLSLTSTATTPKIVFDHVNREAKMYENSVAVGTTFLYPNDGVTLAHLAAWVNGRSGWTAAVSGDPSMPVSCMDNPLLASAPTIAASATNLPANQGALAWMLNAREPYLSATLSTPATLGVLTAVAETSLSGGTGTALDVVAAQDWTNALTKAEAVDAQYLFLATTDNAAQALANQHCIEMMKVTRKRWRIFITGGPAGETESAARTRAAALDGPTTYCWNGTAITDPASGLQRQLGGLGAAAQACGLCSGLPDNEPLSNKSILSEGLENPTVSDSVLTGLLNAGVTPIVADPIRGGVRILQALTTYQSGTNPVWRKLHGLRCQFHLLRGEERVCADVPGTAMDLGSAVSLKYKLSAFYDSEIKSAKNPYGVLTISTEDGRAWRDLRIVGDGGEAWFVDVDACLVGEANYVVIANHLRRPQLSL